MAERVLSDPHANDVLFHGRARGVSSALRRARPARAWDLAGRSPRPDV